jgi:hypothetical protein
MEITTASQPFERCALDIVGPNGATNKGKRYILIFQDDLTKFVAAIPIPTQDSGARVCTKRGIKVWNPPSNFDRPGGELFKRTVRECL